MRCDGIINLNFTENGTLDEELTACSTLMRDRYVARENVTFASCTLSEENCNSVALISQNERDISTPLPGYFAPMESSMAIFRIISMQWSGETNGVSNGNGLGLYIQTHGTVSGGTKPAISKIISVVKYLYDKGLRFRKINLAWCFSAGKEKVAGIDASVGAQFCNGLLMAFSNPPQVHLLEGLFLAGYCSYVTIKNASNENATNSTVARNTFSERAWAATHPHSQASEAVKQLAQEHANLTPGNARALKRVQAKFLIEKNKSTDDGVFLKQAFAYLTSKIIWRIRQGALVRVSIAAYTDSTPISDMVRLLTPISRTTDKGRDVVIQL